jgi:Protein of unknown function (DUF2958)
LVSADPIQRFGQHDIELPPMRVPKERLDARPEDHAGARNPRVLVGGDEPAVKLLNPCGAATWLLTEIDPDDETVAWALCDLGMGCPEFGTVSLTELAAYRGRFGLGVERDLCFKPRGPISAYIEAASRAGRIVEDIARREVLDSTSFVMLGHDQRISPGLRNCQ